MKQLKRSLALMLAVAVLAGLFVTGTSALDKDPVVTGDTHIADYTDVTDKNNSEAIYALTALGIFDGYTGVDAGKFKPEATITRAEFAKVVYYLSGFTAAELPYYAAKASAFKDVPEGHWAEGYINACAERGYYIGFTDGTFRPSENITKQQVVTVNLRLLGYDDHLADGVWPYNYLNKAKGIGLISLTGFAGTQDAIRDEVALYCYDILYYNMVQYIDNDITQGLGYVTGTVDADGYAYLMMKTNEGYKDLVLSKYALGADFVAVNYDTVNGLWNDLLPRRNALGDNNYNGDYAAIDMFESCGWGFENFDKGELQLCGIWVGNISEVNTMRTFGKLFGTVNKTVNDFIDLVMTNGIANIVNSENLQEQAITFLKKILQDDLIYVDYGTKSLASKYYIYGGKLTDLGNNVGATAIIVNDEVVFATVGEKPVGFYDDMFDSYYDNEVGYYDMFTNEPFGIVENVDKNYVYFQEDVKGIYNDTSYYYNYFENNKDFDGYIVENEDLNLWIPHVYFNMTTGKFVDASSLKAGDVVYDAKVLCNEYIKNTNNEDAKLYLVYNPTEGDFTEYDDYPVAKAFVKIDKEKYSIANFESWFSLDSGDNYYNFANLIATAPTAQLDALVREFGTVDYVVAYNQSELAYLRKDLRSTYVYGVITDFKLTSLGLYWDPNAYGTGKGGYQEMWVISGIELFLPDGTTKVFDLADYFYKLGDSTVAADKELDVNYGDLITLEYVDDDGYVVHNQSTNGTNATPYTYNGWVYDYTVAGMLVNGEKCDYNDTLAKIGTSRVSIQWNDDWQFFNGFKKQSDYEVYTTTEETVAFYVKVTPADGMTAASVSVKLLNQEDLLAAGGKYRQILPFRFYNKDNTGLSVLYLTDKVGSANPTTYYVGLATKFTKQSTDSWAITIDGTRYVTTSACTTEDIIPNRVAGNVFVLYQLTSAGKIYNIEKVTDANLINTYFTQEYYDLNTTAVKPTDWVNGGYNPAIENAFELTQNDEGTISLCVSDIANVLLTGEKRVMITNTGIVDYDTLYTTDATVIDMVTGKTMDNGTGLINLVNLGRTFVFIYNEKTNDVMYILATNHGYGEYDVRNISENYNTLVGPIA